MASLTDLKLAPFHLLASEGRVHTDKNHTWHMDTLAKVCREDPELLLATSYKLVDVTDPASEAEGVGWWTELTGRGGEGMVVKPLDFILRGKRGLAQPAVKCRGPEYLRIIYGPDYTAEENLSRLRSRGLGHKRSLALGEFALGRRGAGAVRPPASRCGGSMSASSASSPWRASRWTRGCDAIQRGRRLPRTRGLWAVLMSDELGTVLPLEERRNYSRPSRSHRAARSSSTRPR